MRKPLLWIFVALFLVGLFLSSIGLKMTKSDLHISAAAEPLACIGGVLEGIHCSPGTILPFTNGLLMTLLVDVLVIGAAVLATRRMKVVPRGLQNIFELLVETFHNFAAGVDRKNLAKFFPLPATILIFFLFANMLALVPGVGSIGFCAAGKEEKVAEKVVEHGGPTPLLAQFPAACVGGTHVVPLLRAPAADLNVTFAFALVAVFMVEYFGFQALGWGYLTKFFNFKEGPIGVFVGLIELLSEVIRIIAFAFRIFGNIFGGEVILVVMAFLFPYLLPLPFYGFEVFVALIQAVIFAVLTLVFMSLAVQQHGGHEEHAHGEGEVAAAH